MFCDWVTPISYGIRLDASGQENFSKKFKSYSFHTVTVERLSRWQCVSVDSNSCRIHKIVSNFKKNYGDNAKEQSHGRTLFERSIEEIGVVH